MKFTVVFITMICAGAVMGTMSAFGMEQPISAVVVQEMTGPFDNPEGAIVGMDEKSVFIANAASVSGRFSFTVGAGYITKLAIGADGTLRLVEQKFVKGLTRPWGMGVLPVTVGRYPAGTVFVAVGGPPLEGVKNASKVDYEIIAFSPDTGEILGKIYGGAGSVFEKISEGPVVAINALAFDKKGNLYFTDSAVAWNRFAESGPLSIRQGVWKIEVGRLEELLSGEKHSENTKGLRFCYIAGCPDGIEVSPEGELYVNTVGSAAVYWGPPLYDPFDGAVYHLTDEDFAKGHVTSRPLIDGLGALDGLVFTPAGTMLCSEVLHHNDIIVIKLSGGHAAATFLNVPNLCGPADIAVAEIKGNLYVIIPEHTSGVDDANLPEAAKREVTVIKLLGVK